MTFTRILIIASAVAWSPVLVHAEATAFNDWNFQTSGEGKDKVCFAATVAKDTGEGAGNRSDSVLYISAWPKDGIKSELSIKLGFDAKAAAGARVSVGSAKFDLFINGEHGYVSDATQELKLIEAMKKASSLTVEATSRSGGHVKDRYSLSGIRQALKAQADECP